MTDDELLALKGKPYTKENAKKLIYGGRIDSSGTIIEVMTSKDTKITRRSKISFISLF